MDFLVEMDDELDYNESESPITVMKRTGDTKSSQPHVKSLQHSNEKTRHVVVSPREEGEAYSDDENDSTAAAGELKRDYASKQSTAQVDKEEGEASSEEDRRYDHRYDSKREKISTSKQKHSSEVTNLTLDEIQYRSRLHERYERREREGKRLRSDKDTEATVYDTHRTAYFNEESNSSSGDREDVKSSMKVDDSEVGRKHQSIKAQDIRQKDKSPPQDSRSFKVIQKEREEYSLKYSQSQTSFSKYDTVLSSTSQSVPTALSDKLIGSENLYTSAELNHSPIEVSKKSKSKKSKRERKDREKESSKIRGDDIPSKYSKKESKQRKVHSSSTTSELDYTTTKWGESDQKYGKMISSAVRHDRLHSGMQQQQQHSRSGSLDSISSNSSQMSKASGDSSSSSSHSSPTVHRKSSSVASAHHHHHQHSSSQIPSSSYDRDTTAAYDHRRHHRHHSKRRYHRETRETAPPPEANRPYIGPNQISVKIKHKHKSDKRETLTTTAVAAAVDNNYTTNLSYKREKISQDIESHQDILTEESYRHHKKSKLSKNTEVEASGSRHKKHSSKRSKSKERRSLSQKLSASEQTSRHHRSSKREVGHDERYSEESELDSANTKEVNPDVSDKLVSSKIKDTTNTSSFPSGSNKQNIVEGGETKGSGSFSRFPPRPPRLPQYPGYSESSSESDDLGVGVPDNPFMHNTAISNNGADRKMDVDADEDKYKDFRDDDDEGDGGGNNAKIDSPENSKPPGKPFYFPSIQGCRSVEEFECLNRIEEGTYGVVYRARDKKVNEIVALKRLKMEKERDGFPITSLREINMLMKAQHENIVTVREVVVGSNMDKIYLVMDYVEHDLKSLMEVMNGPFSVGEVKCLLVQLLRAVGHLHDNWILHRDLKTSNLLLSHQGILKVQNNILVQ
ncbi:unnamed protein product [Trichobilharzia szidati]|nr:unnamed protein product [Trichobilharzia szidati]